MIPLKPFPEVIGIKSGAIPVPDVSLRDDTTFSKSAFSLSKPFTKNIFGVFDSSTYDETSSVPTCIPSTASTRTIADSTTLKSSFCFTKKIKKTGSIKNIDFTIFPFTKSQDALKWSFCVFFHQFGYQKYCFHYLLCRV